MDVVFLLIRYEYLNNEKNIRERNFWKRNNAI